MFQKHGHAYSPAESVSRYRYPGHAQSVQMRWARLRHFLHDAGRSHLHPLLLHSRKYTPKPKLCVQVTLL